MSDNDMALSSGTGLSPTVEPASSLAGSAASIPSAVIEEFCTEVHKPLEAMVHGFCDEAYVAIMETVQDYLRENAVFNIRSRFDAQQRELLAALKALRAIEGALTFKEARDNARAVNKGYWSEERAAEYRAQAIEARRAETGTGSVHESAVGNADAPGGDA